MHSRSRMTAGGGGGGVDDQGGEGNLEKRGKPGR